MAYASNKEPGGLTALTSLAVDDVFVVGDTSDASEVAKKITKANLITDLTTSFAPALGADDNYVTDAEKIKLSNLSGTNTGDQSLTGLVPYTGATADIDLGTWDLLTDTVGASTSAGLLVESQNQTQIGLLGAGNTANVAWYGNHNYSLATQDTVAAFTGAGKTLGSLATATYPSLTELAHVKGVTSAIQGQLDAKLALAGGTMTGNIVLGENTSIDLDPAGSADGKYSGIAITGTAGATLAFGDLVYLAAADSRWELTDADASATGGPVLIGMCVLAAAGDASATKILLQGQIRADAKFPALTIGAPVYLGETAGAIQTAIPTGADNVIRVVGFALTADEIYFNPSQDHQISVA